MLHLFALGLRKLGDLACVVIVVATGGLVVGAAIFGQPTDWILLSTGIATGLTFAISGRALCWLLIGRAT